MNLGTWTQAARMSRAATVQPFMRVLPPPQADPKPRYHAGERIETEKGYATIKGHLMMRPKRDGRLESFKEPTVYYDVIFDSGQWWLISEADLVDEVTAWMRGTTANQHPTPTEPMVA